MRTRIVRGPAARQLCADPAFLGQWLDLRRRCPWATGFQEPGFVCSWYEAYRRRAEPVLILGQDESGRLRGLLPLCVSEADGLQVAGMQQAEYHAWLSTLEDCQPFGTAALRAVRPLIPGRSCLRFQYLPPRMPVQWLRQDDAPALNFGQAPQLGLLRAVPRPIQRLGDGREVLESLRKSANKSKIKRMERLGKLVFRQVTDPEEFDRLLDSVVGAYDLRHAAVHGTAPFFNDPLKMGFHRAMMRVPGLLHVTVMTVGQTVAAIHLGVPSNGELQLGITVHDPWLAKHSPAKIHMLLLSKLLIEQGFETFDLTPGGDAYKARFANDWDTVHTLSVYGAAHAQALGQVKSRVRDMAMAYLQARDTTSTEARARFDRIRGRLRPSALPGALRAARRWVRSRATTWIYTLDLATAARQIEAEAADAADAPGEIRRDDQALLLRCPPTPRWPTQRELASAALARFEDGMHVYTLSRADAPDAAGGVRALAWLAEQPDEGLIEEELGGCAVPQDAAVCFDLFTYPQYRRRGCATALLRAIVRHVAASPAKRTLILPVPDDAPAAIRLVERLGAVRSGAIRTRTVCGRSHRQAEFTPPPATPTSSQAADQQTLSAVTS